MQEFSSLYRKMCEKAVEIQDIWKPEEWDECCKKGDHEDGIVKEYHPGILSDEEKKSFKANYAWLPKAHQLEKRVWKTWGLDSIRREVMYVIALMFVMEKVNKEWDFKEEDWVKIKR
jgi:hypothetical protein